MTKIQNPKPYDLEEKAGNQNNKQLFVFRFFWDLEFPVYPVQEVRTNEYRS